MNEYFPNEKNKILMIFMFRGEYLVNKLGHEIINIFKADNEKHYIYVNPYGHVGNEHEDKIGTILLARHVNNSRIEIIAKAWGIIESFSGVYKPHKKVSRDIQKEQITKCENIKYGGKSIVDIFDFKKPNNDQEILISYEVKNYRRPENPLYISYKEEDDEHMPGKMPRQSLHAYFAPQANKNKPNNHNDWKKLKTIIENESLWKADDDSKIVDLNLKHELNLLKIIGKEDDELAFSNWLAYYLKDHDTLDRFARDVLGLTEGIGQSFKLYREEDHIDLLIEDIDHKRYIVIENKIKSDIIKRQKEGDKQKENCSQLDDYGDKVEMRSKGHNKSCPEGNNWKPENNKFFIFTPNYSDVFTKWKSKYESKYDYKEIKYKKLYYFFKNIADKNKDEHPFISDFIIALSRHKGENPDEIFEDTRIKFIETINKIK